MALTVLVSQLPDFLADPPPFVWHCFDVTSQLPLSWNSEIESVADLHSRSRDLKPTSVTSRESPTIDSVPVETVGGITLKEELPWLYDLYRSRFRELAQRITSEPVVTATDDRYGIVLNIQRGKAMRYECHVDSNPIEGLLYVTTHAPGTGGELVIANRGDVDGAELIEMDASRIYPVAGHFILFDARRYTHYVASLRHAHGVRIVAAMNFYTPNSPESERPSDLNRHLFGKD